MSIQMVEIRPNPEVIGQRLGEEFVLIHMRTNQMYELNQTAAWIWELLTEGHALSRIHERIKDEFDLEGVDLQGEINDLLTQLEAARLIVGV